LDSLAEHAIGPHLAFLLNPFALIGLVANEPSKAATSSHDFKTKVLETSLSFSSFWSFATTLVTGNSGAVTFWEA
jgi:uncharacterized membrane protein